MVRLSAPARTDRAASRPETVADSMLSQLERALDQSDLLPALERAQRRAWGA